MTLSLTPHGFKHSRHLISDIIADIVADIITGELASGCPPVQPCDLYMLSDPTVIEACLLERGVSLRSDQEADLANLGHCGAGKAQREPGEPHNPVRAGRGEAPASRRRCATGQATQGTYPGVDLYTREWGARSSRLVRSWKHFLQ